MKRYGQGQAVGILLPNLRKALNVSCKAFLPICEFSKLRKDTYLCLRKTRIMATKLTLTIEEEVIRAAKTYAKKKGRSVSDLVETYLKNLAGNNKTADDLSPQVKRLIGSVNLPSDFNYKDELSRQIKFKHKK